MNTNNIFDDKQITKFATHHKQLHVYQNAMESAMEIFHFSKHFPMEERFSLTDQIRRSSHSVCANLAEAWRKRRYKAAFIAKLSDSESEACETQIWIELAKNCNYLDSNKANKLDHSYNLIISQIIRMIEEADKWLIKNK